VKTTSFNDYSITFTWKVQFVRDKGQPEEDIIVHPIKISASKD
jgi:hypothetical protein